MMKTAAFDAGTVYQFRVHLDTTKVLEDGTPDPEWVNEYTWGKQPPVGQTAQVYLTNCKREAEGLAKLDPRLQPPPTEIVLP